ncbi:MAG: cohesin domain-containing protein [Bacteroidetes bacterium]|nr:cohesin domain-containing protein [Bacteroidota bacterium]
MRIKDGVNIFSTYAYLNFDNTVLKLVNSKPGTYLGSQIINQSPVVTGGKIDFGLTQTFGQTGASGDGIVYEFKFLVKAAPPVMTFINKTELYFNLTNLSIYNALGLQPSSFNYLSSLKDTSICKVLVWPGDLNSDKKVSVADLLPIGYFYGLNGPARAGGNLSWTAQPAVLWGSDMTTQSSSAYRVFADGNADGTISLADQAAIGFNLSKSHAKQITQAIAIAPQKSFPTNMPAINVDIPDTLIPKASLPLTQTINITVGSSSYSINNLYGVAFEIYFNPACVNTAAISTNYTSSIFGTQNVDYTKLEDYSEITTGKLSIALTRFNTTSIVGNGGKVLSINLPFLATAPVGWFKVTAIPLGCNDNLGNTISVTGSENSLRIAAADLLISGRCITPLSKSIKKVNCNLSGIGILASDILGGYEFSSGISANANYTLSPTKNNDISKANGISATDVLLTQRHILNTSKLNSAYKLIAADVNGDKNINATDVLRIKRLILGTDTTFTKGSGANKVDRLWEFVDSAYQFPDTTNPFPFKDSIVFTNLTSSKINQTFIGVKLGDVNYDWNAALSRGVAVNNLQLVYNVISTKEKSTQTDFSGTNLRNEELLIPITVNNFKNLAAMQYTLHFDNSKYEFVGIENNKLGIDFNEKQANTTGNIAMLWTDKNGQAKTLEDGSELFTLVLKPVNNPLSIDNSLLTITNDIAEVEAWDNDFKKHNIVLTQKVSAKDQEPKTKDQLVIYPNPTNGIVNIECANAKQVVMTDCLGRRIKEYNNPTQLLTFNCKLLTKGIYIVQVTMKDGTIKSEKLVVE